MSHALDVSTDVTLHPEAAERARVLYRELHRTPELSGRERRTAARVSAQLAAYGVRVHERIGGHGVAAVLDNGPGPVVLLRAELDGLAVTETTGLEYASELRTTLDGRQVGVSHACGHDVHMAALLTAVERFTRLRARWSGTVVAVFQPAEENGLGAAAMVAGGLFDRVPAPDVVLAQHVSPDPLGAVTFGPGTVLSASATLRVTIHGTGGHTAFPDQAIDVVSLALELLGTARTLADEAGVGLAVSAIHGGAAGNAYPERVGVDLSLRCGDEHALALVVDSLRALARHVTVRAGVRPADVEQVVRFGTVVNEPAAAARVYQSLAATGRPVFLMTGPSPASDDVGVLAAAASAPLVYWFLGGTDPAAHDGADAEQPGRSRPSGVPMNHSPRFAPHPDAAVHGAELLLLAARPWLA